MYKIVCKDESVSDCYVGHTTNFPRRKNEHKSSCNNSNSKNYNFKVYQSIRSNGGLDNWDMIEIEKYPCENIFQVREKERYWIETLGATLNTNIPNRTDEEWREENKEYLIEKKHSYNHVYYQEHNEELKEKTKDWYQENKEYASLYHKEYREKNKEHIAERLRKYALEHKEELKEYQRQWYLKKKLEKQQQEGK